MSDPQLPGMPNPPLAPLKRWAVTVETLDRMPMEYDAVRSPMFDGSGNWLIIEPVGGGYVFIARDDAVIVTTFPMEES